MKNYRQGDVYIFQVEKIDKELETKKEVVLAEGETTGHKHVLVADKGTKIRMAQDEKGFYLDISGGTATIKHEEHAAIKLEPGLYFANIQQEYDPIVYRRKVSD